MFSGSDAIKDSGLAPIQVIKKATIFDDAEYKDNLKNLERQAREMQAELKAEKAEERQAMARAKKAAEIQQQLRETQAAEDARLALLEEERRKQQMQD
jgi:hypothetical protein